MKAREVPSGDDAIWRALSNGKRRSLLDALRDGPLTTGELARRSPGLSRYAVMQHLGVLTEAGLVLVRREGRHRFNYLNASPVQQVYERWVTRLAGEAAKEAASVKRAVETVPPPTQEEQEMTADRDAFRVVRIENELSFAAPAERVFDVLTQRVREWFPATYGGERTRAVVLEPRLNGAVYEAWDGEAGYLYGHVTTWDPPHSVAMRTRLFPGTTMDTTYSLEGTPAGTTFAMSRVVVGPISEEQAASIQVHGDMTQFEEALRGLIEG